METLLLTARDIAELIDIRMALTAAEGAFRASGLGRAIMPPKVYLYLDKFHGDFRAMPAYVEGAAGCKWVNVHPDNRAQGLPTVMAVVIYSDPATGFPLAIMDGTTITNYRTGASGGVAAKYLARSDAKTLGLVGSGAQAQAQLMAVRAVRDIDEILAWSPSCDSVDACVERNRALGARAAPLEEVCGCDIVCTTTPSREPLVRREWVRPGAHINAIGADAAGKQELDPAVLNAATVVVDDMVQAVHGGEVNVAISSGAYAEDRIYGTLGEIVAGSKGGRGAGSDGSMPETGTARGRTPLGLEAITVFDSTGLAIQDVALARALYEKARLAGVGQEIDLIG